MWSTREGGVWKVCVHTMCLHEEVWVHVCPCLGKAMCTCVYIEA